MPGGRSGCAGRQLGGDGFGGGEAKHDRSPSGRRYVQVIAAALFVEVEVESAELDVIDRDVIPGRWRSAGASTIAEDQS